ncbi:Asp-tRNA(Asn)/Glu-tRNA(Gln) amidotransferase subunit GatC [bacterium]|jgi:aspartyl-tRNA(Asn)/glutamyl-tRNA(Gln) amidotransferase subunit C|nr:Asp-tRNA(Asn)/Glu-tRNA(Gln) amidotransferase subunit GatC [bacterium]
MSKLKKEDVLNLAELVRLDLTDDEVNEFTEELSAILDYVEQLGDVDVSGLEPTNQVTGLTNVTRKDEIKDYGYSLEDLQSNLPDSKGNLIKVKRMLN